MPTVPITPQNFFDQPGLGTVIKAALGIMGLLVVVFAIVRVIKHVAGGQIGAAVKTVVGSLCLAAFMLFPGQLIYPAIQGFTGIITSVINTVSSVGGSSSAPPVTAPLTTTT